MMMDNYCLNCHPDAYRGWFHSAHRFSSFNNKPYLFSVRETRQVALKRDGNVKAASTRVFAGNNGATSNEPGFCHAKACPS